MTGLYQLTELRPAELAARIAAVPALVLPMGTIEWHSHHLPLGLDGLKAQALAEGVAERTGAVLAPATWWAAGGVPFPYTLRLPADLIAPLLREVLIQYARMGFRTLLIMNGHFGLENSVLVRRAAVHCMQATAATVLPVAEYEVLTDLGNHGDHAGIWETSLLWAARPDLVHLDAVPPEAELPGVLGEDPRGRASRELGEHGVRTVVERVAATVQRSLNEEPMVRERYLGAVDAGLRALAALLEIRARRPRSEVPPVLTNSWRNHLQALAAGRYAEAARWAEAKWADPAS